VVILFNKLAYISLIVIGENDWLKAKSGV